MQAAGAAPCKTTNCAGVAGGKGCYGCCAACRVPGRAENGDNWLCPSGKCTANSRCGGSCKSRGRGQAANGPADREGGALLQMQQRIQENLDPENGAVLHVPGMDADDSAEVHQRMAGVENQHLASLELGDPSFL